MKPITTSTGLADDMAEYLIWAYATAGLSNRAMRTQLGVTDYQISRVLKKAGVKRIDYRDAVSPFGKAVVNKLDQLSERMLVDHIEKHLIK
jgi:hypothetical protein